MNWFDLVGLVVLVIGVIASLMRKQKFYVVIAFPVVLDIYSIVGVARGDNLLAVVTLVLASVIMMLGVFLFRAEEKPHSD